MTTKAAIHLGFQVPTGTPVAIPLRHLAICGQTQEAGKTTALEALITRADMHAVTFITKRGEASFTSARRLPPYFREQADWQFVASILEASRGEKLKIERAWIIRASKGARTLADVHANVRKAMTDPKIRGMSADMYLTLDAYLEVVVPQIARVDWAPRVDLAPGVNAMDLTALAGEMQHLVIKSTIDWVLEHAANTVVVVPEAWKFIPQGRGTPVKRAAAAFIRQGAALGNYLWLDSQDLGGIEKEILRSVPVWIFGVQREANELKRSLENIPEGIAKPSRTDLATLDLGQFFVCWGKHAIRTYAQPAWMPEDLARQVATGALDVANASAIAAGANVAKAARRAGFTSTRAIAQQLTEATVTKAEADRLTRENADLRDQVTRLTARLEALDKGQHGDVERPHGHHQHRAAARAVDADAGAAARHHGRRAPGAGGDAIATSHPDFPGDAEGFYQDIKARLIAEAPALLRLLVDVPTLEVSVEQRIIEAEGASTTGRVARLIKGGFLEESRRFREILVELERTGTRVNNKSLSITLKELVSAGFLTKESVDRYRAVPEMRVNVVQRVA